MEKGACSRNETEKATWFSNPVQKAPHQEQGRRKQSGRWKGSIIPILLFQFCISCIFCKQVFFFFFFSLPGSQYRKRWADNIENTSKTMCVMVESRMGEWDTQVSMLCSSQRRGPYKVLTPLFCIRIRGVEFPPSNEPALQRVKHFAPRVFKRQREVCVSNSHVEGDFVGSQVDGTA
jgi:hypothetical protein